MDKKYKSRFGDKDDGRLIRGKELDSNHWVMPLVWPNRTDNEAYIYQLIDLTNMDEYLLKKNKDNTKNRYSMFLVILTAIAKTFYQRPKLNRFYRAGKLYERYDVTAGFVTKQEMSDEGEEALSKLFFEPSDTIETISIKLKNEIDNKRNGKGDKTLDDARFLMKLPPFIGKSFVRFTRWLNTKTCIPRSLRASDVYFDSIILSHLGSIQLHSGYHHLSNWGTNSFFITIGEKKIRPFYDKQGNKEMKNSIDLGLTIDERIADGFYYSRSIRLFKYYLEHPEILEKPLKEE